MQSDMTFTVVVYVLKSVDIYWANALLFLIDVVTAAVSTDSKVFLSSTKASVRGMLYSDVFTISWLNACMWSIVEYPYLNPV